MISSPINHPQLDVEREKHILLEALHVLSDQGKVHVKFLEKATLANLQHYLRDNIYHIFHFIGHGEFNKKSKEGELILEDEKEHGWSAGAHRIGTILHDHRSLWLAVLNSCEGARNSRADPSDGILFDLSKETPTDEGQSTIKEFTTIADATIDGQTELVPKRRVTSNLAKIPTFFTAYAAKNAAALREAVPLW